MGTGTIDPLRDRGVTSARRAPSLDDAGCRLLDLAVASCAIVLLAPVLAVIALIIRCNSPGPALFRQRRVGRALEPFTVNKFRTMAVGASHEAHRRFVQALIAGERPAAAAGAPQFKLAADSRITGVGGFLRRTSLDELPQLFNVIRGEMSLVGPRPAIPYEVDHYPPHWFGRFDVKPGMTGLWQVSGRGELTVPEMIELDLEYVARRSVRLNLWILIRTVPAVFSRRGAS